jgi:LuxR family maltose regulon positive regulatory protein
MDDSDVRLRDGRPRGTDMPVFDFVASKLRRPLVRPGTIRRLPLIERLARGDRCPIVSVVAPPGYGKDNIPVAVG